MKKLVSEWKKGFDEAVVSVEKYIKPQDNDDAQTTKFRQLANWMLSNDYSPHEYMSLGHQVFKSTPHDTDFSLSMLYNALIDDGDVAFVSFKVEGETQRVFMMFADMHDEVFLKLCKEENQATINSLISLRESYLGVINMMKQNFSKDQIFSPASPLKDADFTFNAHRDPLLFIKEFEKYQIEKAEKNKLTNESMNNYKAGKKM